MTPRRWGKAGIPLTEAEIADNRRRAGLRQLQSAQVRARSDAIARRKWAAGMVVPYMITLALDAKSLFGPEVDLACGVEEPAVDMWEAGRLYPTWEQLCALAELTGNTPEWFTLEPKLTPLDTSMRFHVPIRDLGDLGARVMRFPAEVVALCAGTAPPNPKDFTVAPVGAQLDLFTTTTPGDTRE